MYIHIIYVHIYYIDYIDTYTYTTNLEAATMRLLHQQVKIPGYF